MKKILHIFYVLAVLSTAWFVISSLFIHVSVVLNQVVSPQIAMTCGVSSHFSIFFWVITKIDFQNHSVSNFASTI
jgi:hypothetical protein